MVRVLKWTGLTLLALVLLFLGYLAYRLVPADDPRPLPPDLISAESEEGAGLLQSATAKDDYEELAENFEAQKLTSFCGVASSVVTLKSLGRDVTQTSVFNEKASNVRPIWQVAVGGMTIDIFAKILEANGAKVVLHRPGPEGLETFREAVERNLSTDADYLLVNYQRQVLGQDQVGHISPLAAYDKESDRVLVMDTAAYKYPFTWVPLIDLYRAMEATDPETGKSRGWVEVSDT